MKLKKLRIFRKKSQFLCFFHCSKFFQQSLSFVFPSNLIMLHQSTNDFAFHNENEDLRCVRKHTFDKYNCFAIEIDYFFRITTEDCPVYNFPNGQRA